LVNGKLFILYKNSVLRTENDKFVLIVSFASCLLILSFIITSISSQEKNDEMTKFVQTISDSIIFIFSPVKILDEIDYDPSDSWGVSVYVGNQLAEY